MDAPVTEDLAVETLSQSLMGFQIDVVVSGSIAAMESPRFVRALRRLGAQTRVILTDSGAQFTTTTALEWASGQKVIRQFSGLDSHIATGDACVIAPCSAQMIHDIAEGVTKTPATALIASYLGLKRPVIMVCNMHESLWLSPRVQANFAKIAPFVRTPPPRREEGKLKFPDPQRLANHVSFEVNRKEAREVVVTMGPTRGYWDPVRYISNYSSGALGSVITEELYRLGHTVKVIAGPCQVYPSSFSSFVPVDTYDDLHEALGDAVRLEPKALVMAASVLDFVPSETSKTKISSDQPLTIELKPTRKLLAEYPLSQGKTFCFKLGTGLTEREMRQLGESYLKKYGVTSCIVNDRKHVTKSSHQAVAFHIHDAQMVETSLTSKFGIAHYIAAHL